jgi:hypothetical protein
MFVLIFGVQDLHQLLEIEKVGTNVTPGGPLGGCDTILNKCQLYFIKHCLLIQLFDGLSDPDTVGCLNVSLTPIQWGVQICLAKPYYIKVGR